MYSGQTRPYVEYDRQIRYLDYVENGQRVKGAGFVKFERRDGRCNISLQVSGLYRRDHFTRPLIMLSGENESELCKLQLADGGIKTYVEGLDSHNMDGRGLDYAQISGMRIPISEGKSIVCIWNPHGMRTDRVSAADMPVDKVNAGENADSETYINNSSKAYNIESDKNRANKNETHNNNVNISEVNKNIVNSSENDKTKAYNNNVDISEANNNIADSNADNIVTPETAAFNEDKWGQLWAIYPHIRPFSDDREYLSLGPSDFVILPSRYYKLVNNSFLLHGYYNYHHLILIRVNQKNNTQYYIGVPGNLYQKEKKIAVMFGFESFECAEEPASEGDFGYYLIPVEI